MRLIAVGKIKESYIEEGIKDFTRRISRFTRLDVTEVKDEKILKDDKKIKEIEGDRILKQIKDDEFVMALDETGTNPNSKEFAALLKKNQEKKMVFVIGGALGLGDNVKNRSNFTISLSSMTFPHQMARLILLEQIYRAHMILGKREYHK